MNKYVILPVVFVLAVLASIERHAYIAAILGFSAAVLCLANLKPLGGNLEKNRGKIIAFLAIMMVVLMMIKW